MSDSEFYLVSSSRAVLGLEDAIHLLEQKERIEQAVVANDPAVTLDTAKAFLESVLKTILSDRVVEPNLSQDMNALYKSVRDVLPLNRDNYAAERLKRLTNSIVNNVSDLRNQFGAASHGDDGYYENPIEMPEAEMVAHLVDGMSGFLFRKHKSHGDPELAARIYYNDHPDFNDYLDAEREGYKFELDQERAIELAPSQMLFYSDENAYRELLIQFISAQKEEEAVEQEIIEVVPRKVVVEPTEVVQLSIEEGVAQVMEAILVNNEARMSINDDELRQVAEFVVDYAQNRAGIDWQSRESLKARFRTFLRRELIKVTFSEAFMVHAVAAAIEKAAELYPSRMGIS